MSATETRGRPPRRRARGMTLVEILISLALVLAGVMVMFRTLGSAAQGGSFGSQMAQAQMRASAILEAIRNAPASSLTCLVANAATGWSACETDCKNAQTGAGATLPQSCIFTTAAFSNIVGPTVGTYHDLQVDRSGQKYAVVYSNANPTVYRTTFVRQTGPGKRVYDVQVTVGWNSDPVGATPNHFVTLRSGVFN